MCDTFVADRSTTRDGTVILGKNSDREPNEAHHVVHVPAKSHEPGAALRATYVEVPQAPRTRAVLLCKPYWIWGAEMGVNDAGVAIGNEAVFTKSPREKDPGLLGMDLLRLALERAGSADEAVDIITRLLEEYGQSGKAGHTSDLQYDNSYLIADGRGAWVLETVGRDWVVSAVRGSRSISNALTIRGDYDRASPGLTDATDVARQYSDFLYTRLSDSTARQCRTTDALAANQGSVTVADAMALLRDHGPGGNAPLWSPAEGLTGQSVCAHAGFGPIRVSQSTGSMVAEIRAGSATVWVTATSAPCLSVFKPIWLDTGLPDLGPAPGRHHDPASLWWRHEDLHRAALADFADRAPAIRRRLGDLEAELIEEAAILVEGDSRLTRQGRGALTESAFGLARVAEEELAESLRTRAVVHRQPRLYRRAWRSFDNDAHRQVAS